MGAKFSALFLAALAATGCAGGLKRFAPPGLVKYEELANDEPINPAIAERVKEHKKQPGGGFPNLSEQPTELPEGIAKPERDAMLGELLVQRDLLNAAAAEDRAEAAAERDGSLGEARDALGEAIESDDAAARRERGLAPRKKPETDEQ